MSINAVIPKYSGFKNDLQSVEAVLQTLAANATDIALPPKDELDAQVTIRERVNQILTTIQTLRETNEELPGEKDRLWSEIRTLVDDSVLAAPPANLNSDGRELWAFSNKMRAIRSKLEIMQNQYWRERVEDSVKVIEQAEQRYKDRIDEAAKEINPVEYPSRTRLDQDSLVVDREYELADEEYRNEYPKLEGNANVLRSDLAEFDRQHPDLKKEVEHANEQLAKAEKALALQTEFVNKLDGELDEANAEWERNYNQNRDRARSIFDDAGRLKDDADDLVKKTEDRIAENEKEIADFEATVKKLDEAELQADYYSTDMSDEARLTYLSKVTLQNLRSEAMIKDMPEQMKNSFLRSPSGEELTREKANEMIRAGRAYLNAQDGLRDVLLNQNTEYTRHAMQMGERFNGYKASLQQLCEKNEVLSAILPAVQKAETIEALESCVEDAGVLVEGSSASARRTISAEMEESLNNLVERFHGLNGRKQQLSADRAQLPGLRKKAEDAEKIFDEARTTYNDTIDELDAVPSPKDRLAEAQKKQKAAQDEVQELKKVKQGIDGLVESRAKKEADLAALEADKLKMQNRFSRAGAEKNRIDSLKDTVEGIDSYYIDVNARCNDLRMEVMMGPESSERNQRLGAENHQPILDTLKHYADTANLAKESGHRNTQEFEDMVGSVNAIMEIAPKDGEMPLTNEELISKLQQVVNAAQTYHDRKLTGFHPFRFTMRETRLKYAETLKSFAEEAIAQLQENVRVADEAAAKMNAIEGRVYNGEDPFVTVDHIRKSVAPIGRSKYWTYDGKKRDAKVNAEPASVLEEKANQQEMKAVDDLLNYGAFGVRDDRDVPVFRSFKRTLTALAQDRGMRNYIVALNHRKEGEAVSPLFRVYQDYQERFENSETNEEAEKYLTSVMEKSLNQPTIKAVGNQAEKQLDKQIQAQINQ